MGPQPRDPQKFVRRLTGLLFDPGTEGGIGNQKIRAFAEAGKRHTRTSATPHFERHRNKRERREHTRLPASAAFQQIRARQPKQRETDKES